MSGKEFFIKMVLFYTFNSGFLKRMLQFQTHLISLHYEFPCIRCMKVIPLFFMFVVFLRFSYFALTDLTTDSLSGPQVLLSRLWIN